MGQYKMWEAIEKVITVFAPIITSIITIIAVRMQIINDRKMQNRPEIVLKKYEEINKDKSKVLNKNGSNDLCHSEEEELFSPSFETERIKDIVDLTKINKSNYRIELINVGEGIAKNIKIFYIKTEKKEIDKCMLGSETLTIRKDGSLYLRINKMPYGTNYFIMKSEDTLKNKYFNILKLISSIDDKHNIFKVILFSEEEYRRLEIDNFSWEGRKDVRDNKIKISKQCQKTILKAIKYIRNNEFKIQYNKVIKI